MCNTDVNHRHPLERSCASNCLVAAAEQMRVLTYYDTIGKTCATRYCIRRTISGTSRIVKRGLQKLSGFHEEEAVL
jgi:hypothetical protein